MGRRREAVEFACGARLWGHALAAGARLDPPMTGGILSAFLEGLPQGNVLHTLVQHVSRRRVEVVKVSKKKLMHNFIYTEKFFRILVKSNRNQLVFIIFLFIWKQTVHV